MIFKMKWAIPTLLCLLFLTVYFSHSLNRHNSYNSHAFDLGIYTQITYLYSQGLTPYSSLKHMNLLADHFGPILAIISPLYRLFPNPVTLLFIQSLFVSLSAIPIYLIALDKLKNKLVATIITVAYLSSPGIFSAVFFDFHLATISVLPLSFMLFFWHFKHWRLYWLTQAISILFKEDIPIFVLGLGLYQLFTKQRYQGLFTILFALSSFYLIKFQIMPFLWKDAASGYINSSILPLDSPVDMLLLFFTRPTIFLDQFFGAEVKLNTLTGLYSQFGFLAFLNPLSLLTVIPYLFLRFSSTMTQLWTNNWHHNANLIPFLAISTIYAIYRFHLSNKAVIILISVSMFLGGLSPHSPVWSALQSTQNRYPQFDYLSSTVVIIPPNASVSAQSPLVPRLSNREYIYLYPEIYDAEYIVLDPALSAYPLTNDDLKNRINALSESKDWTLIRKEKTLLIFQKSPTRS